MQAIQTKFHPPTNTRGARYKATCRAGSVTVSCDYSLNDENNHKIAAMALCAKLGRVVPHYGRMVGGTLSDRGWDMVWVFDDKSSPSFQIQATAKETEQ